MDLELLSAVKKPKLEDELCSSEHQVQTSQPSVSIQSKVKNETTIDKPLEHRSTQAGGNQKVSPPVLPAVCNKPIGSHELSGTPIRQSDFKREPRQPKSNDIRASQLTSTPSKKVEDFKKKFCNEISTAVLNVVQKTQSMFDSRAEQQIAELQSALRLEKDARKQAEKQSERLKLERDTFENQASDLMSKKSRLEQDLSCTADGKPRLRVQVEALQKENKTLSSALNDAQTQLARSHQADASSNRQGKVSDSTIQDEWKQLQYNIKSLAFSLERLPNRSQIVGGLRNRLRQTSLNAPYYMEEEEDRALLLQGYLWRLMILQVFVGSQGNLQARAKRSFKAFRKSLFDLEKGNAEQMEALGPWLSAGWKILNRNGHTSGALQQVVASEAKKLEPFMLGDGRKSPRQLRRVEDDLRKIIESALKLDDWFQSSRAAFQIWAGDKGRPSYYKADTMDAIACSQEPTFVSEVELFVSPSLVKIGNADGHRYDASIVLAKAQVVCP